MSKKKVKGEHGRVWKDNVPKPLELEPIPRKPKANKPKANKPRAKCLREALGLPVGSNQIRPYGGAPLKEVRRRPARPVMTGRPVYDNV